ncbi:hypothetical protein TYRP_000652 [Tyrophagus putrescentiae]|nr:hypothetical protein TYRP_000652 [Tyrophagus putrescentiae]
MRLDTSMSMPDLEASSAASLGAACLTPPVKTSSSSFSLKTILVFSLMFFFSSRFTTAAFDRAFFRYALKARCAVSLRATSRASSASTFRPMTVSFLGFTSMRSMGTFFSVSACTMASSSLGTSTNSDSPPSLEASRPPHSMNIGGHRLGTVQLQHPVNGGKIQTTRGDVSGEEDHRLGTGAETIVHRHTLHLMEGAVECQQGDARP